MERKTGEGEHLFFDALKLLSSANTDFSIAAVSVSFAGRGLGVTRRAQTENGYGHGYYNEVSLGNESSFSAPINSRPLPIPSL
ncbi:MAG TPA: hypothetical protein VEJ88_02635 [Dissulfurispiraceae bacterium]|nr:hypothetical protein [Dissulfurispiraceae bacterium]